MTIHSFGEARGCGRIVVDRVQATRPRCVRNGCCRVAAAESLWIECRAPSFMTCSCRFGVAAAESLWIECRQPACCAEPSTIPRGCGRIVVDRVQVRRGRASEGARRGRLRQNRCGSSAGDGSATGAHSCGRWLRQNRCGSSAGAAVRSRAAVRHRWLRQNRCGSSAGAAPASQPVAPHAVAAAESLWIECRSRGSVHARDGASCGCGRIVVDRVQVHLRARGNLPGHRVAAAESLWIECRNAGDNGMIAGDASGCGRIVVDRVQVEGGASAVCRSRRWLRQNRCGSSAGSETPSRASGMRLAMWLRQNRCGSSAGTRASARSTRSRARGCGRI